MEFSSFFEYPNSDQSEGTDDLPFLSNCSEDEWNRIVARTQRRQFMTGNTIIKQGDTDRALYIVASGYLEVRVPHPKGYGTRMHPIERGCVFGEQSFLDGRPRSADVVSVTDGELLVLSLEAFQVLGGWEPKLGMQILLDLGRILSLRLRWMTQLLPK